MNDGPGYGPVPPIPTEEDYLVSVNPVVVNIYKATEDADEFWTPQASTDSKASVIAFFTAMAERLGDEDDYNTFLNILSENEDNIYLDNTGALHVPDSITNFFATRIPPRTQSTIFCDGYIILGQALGINSDGLISAQGMEKYVASDGSVQTEDDKTVTCDGYVETAPV